MPPMPPYLYHATPKGNGASIAKSGLQPRSVGGSKTTYLCMSGAEAGAATLGSQASDIIFRVETSKLNAASWSESGAGKKEWRSTDTIAASALEYRRNLGNATQKTWRGALLYPQGL